VDVRFPDINFVKPKTYVSQYYMDMEKLVTIVRGASKEVKKGSIKIGEPSSGTSDIYGGENNEFSKIGTIACTNLSENAEPSQNYVLIAKKASEEELTYQYSKIKKFLDTAIKYGVYDTKDNLKERLLATDMGVQMCNLSDDIFSTDQDDSGKEPKEPKAKKQSKPKKQDETESKKDELKKAIKVLKLLEQKGNKIAGKTVKALEILLKKM
jgi:hypothetical protein